MPDLTHYMDYMKIFTSMMSWSPLRPTTSIAAKINTFQISSLIIFPMVLCYMNNLEHLLTRIRYTASMSSKSKPAIISISLRSLQNF